MDFVKKEPLSLFDRIENLRFDTSTCVSYLEVFPELSKVITTFESWDSLCEDMLLALQSERASAQSYKRSAERTLLRTSRKEADFAGILSCTRDSWKSLLDEMEAKVIEQRQLSIRMESDHLKSLQMLEEAFEDEFEDEFSLQFNSDAWESQLETSIDREADMFLEMWRASNQKTSTKINTDTFRHTSASPGFLGSNDVKLEDLLRVPSLLDDLDMDSVNSEDLL